jgi:hypothetical protein
MTWRAFIIGLVCVLVVCLSDPYTSFARSYGWSTVGHFPSAAVFLLVLLTVGVNALLQWLRRGWALRQAELMLVWCMLIVAVMVTCSGLTRWFPPMLAGPAYISSRPDIPWGPALAEAPAGLLLTKDPHSVAARQFFEGHVANAYIPWGQWLRPVATWAVFLLLFYLSVIFMCALLRRQWVDRERLQFPLARVPLEFTEGSGGADLLPAIFHKRAFLLALAVTAAFRLLRDMPLFFGATSGWNVHLPLKDVLAGTPLQQLYMQNFDLWWVALGFAFLVPADVSLSVWFFYLFGRFELQTAYWAGSDLHSGGTLSPLMTWQTVGAYMAFTLQVLVMARRHLFDVVRKAFGRGRSVDDGEEPVRFALSFWGLVLCTAGGIAWSVHFGMRAWSAALLFLLMLSIMLVSARIVSQSGIYITECLWSPVSVLHGLSFGHVFGLQGALISRMEAGLLVTTNDSMLAPAAMHSFRIADVMPAGRSRRLLLPALVAALMVGMAAATYTGIRQGYEMGALNYTDVWGATGKPAATFSTAYQAMLRPEAIDQARWMPFCLGIVLTSFVMLMRTRFFWWPVHPIGLLALSSWNMDRLWVPFLLGWMTKTFLMKFGGGRALRQARYFFIALIIVEMTVGAISTLVRTITAGSVPGF